MAPVYTDSVDPSVGFGVDWCIPSMEEMEGMTQEQLMDLWKAKQLVEEGQRQDMLQWGWVMPAWREVLGDFRDSRIQVLLGGNRSGKSTFLSRLMVRLAEMIPEAKIRCFHVNEEKSIAEQQALIWEALPAKYKNMGKRKGLNYSVAYSQKNGFTGGKLILPPVKGYSRGSEIIFQNYQQYRNDPQIAEGWWAHAIWGDEELPQKLFETLQYRIVDVRGKIFLSFTTLQGWTPLVADLLTKTRDVRRRYSTLLKRELPVVQDCLTRQGCRIYYLWTTDNPFVPADDFVKSLAGRPEPEVLARAHGIPTKANASPFPLFDEKVHIVKADALPWKRPQKRTTDGKLLPEDQFTRYMAIDPAGAKSWFILWAAVDAANRVWVYREWPAAVWGEPGDNDDGKAGPGMRPNGFGISDYVRTITALEDGERIFERYIDPRMSQAEMPTMDGSTNILTELNDAGMHILPAPGLQIDHGLSLINEKLSYNRDMPLSVTNTPHLFISEECQNLIDAIKNLPANANRNCVWKDPIDVLRYLLESGIEYVSEEMLRNDSRTFSY